MSLATAEEVLTRTPQPGDLIIFRVGGKPAPTQTPAPGIDRIYEDAPAKGEHPENASKEDLEERAIAKMLDALKGADLVTRIRKYEDYVRANPEGRFARVLYEEASSLRRLHEADTTPKSKSASTTENEPALIRFEGPTTAVEGAPLDIAIELNDNNTTGAVLHIRSKGKPAYEHLVMSTRGQGYWSATIPGNRIGSDGFEYFIEAIEAKGSPLPVVGGVNSPREVAVVETPQAARPKKLLATAVLLTDFADYNGFKGNDQVWQTEGYFGLRANDTGIRALRSGFGVYRGIGGSLYDLDTLKLKGRTVGLTYGYLELEVGAHRLFSIIGRAAVGLQDNGVAGGGQLLFRVGNDRETNLLFGGELLGGVGLRGITQLQLNTLKRVPILIRTEVTNQPAGVSKPTGDPNTPPTESKKSGEVGVRGIIQAGYRFTQALTISGRISFQGRTINHAGLGFGGAVGYEW
jgi:hypothetical protein